MGVCKNELRAYRTSLCRVKNYDIISSNQSLKTDKHNCKEHKDLTFKINTGKTEQLHGIPVLVTPNTKICLFDHHSSNIFLFWIDDTQRSPTLCMRTECLIMRTDLLDPVEFLEANVTQTRVQQKMDFT